MTRISCIYIYVPNVILLGRRKRIIKFTYADRPYKMIMNDNDNDKYTNKYTNKNTNKYNILFFLNKIDVI